MELHCRRKERRGGNCGRAVTTVDKRLSQRVWLCTKEEGWNGTQVSKKPNYEIKKIWAVCGAQAAFPSFQLFISERFQKIGKEGGGGESFECRDDSFIVMTIRAEMGEWNKRFLVKKGVIPLGFKVVMKGEDLNAEVVKVREE